MSILSELNPLNWLKDIEGAGNALSHSVGSALVQLLQLFMSVFAALVEEVIYVASLAIYGILQIIFSTADAAGPFALPVFLVMISAFWILGQILLGTARDIPVLEAFT